VVEFPPAMVEFPVAVLEFPPAMVEFPVAVVGVSAGDGGVPAGDGGGVLPATVLKRASDRAVPAEGLNLLSVDWTAIGPS
jgi:hypothetical protein